MGWHRLIACASNEGSLPLAHTRTLRESQISSTLEILGYRCSFPKVGQIRSILNLETENYCYLDSNSIQDTGRKNLWKEPKRPLSDGLLGSEMSQTQGFDCGMLVVVSEILSWTFWGHAMGKLTQQRSPKAPKAAGRALKLLTLPQVNLEVPRGLNLHLKLEECRVEDFLKGPNIILVHT